MDRLVCGMSDSVSKNCIYYKPKETFDCTVKDNKCIMTGNEIPKKNDGHFKSLEEYKEYIDKLISKQFKSFDYVSGHITCLKEHHLVSLEASLDLLIFASDTNLKRMERIKNVK